MDGQRCVVVLDCDLHWDHFLVERGAEGWRISGLIDFADMIYVRSELYRKKRKKAEKAILFGEKEGRIALANRRSLSIRLPSGSVPT